MTAENMWWVRRPVMTAVSAALTLTTLPPCVTHHPVPTLLSMERLVSCEGAKVGG